MKNRRRNVDAGFTFENLERREVMTVSIVNEIPNISQNNAQPTTTLSLLGRYTDSFVTQVVRMVTNHGNIDVALRSDWAPNTVTNFLQYVNEGFYSNTIFHRSQRPTLSNNYGIIQGGGFRGPTTDYDGNPANLSATNQPIQIPSNQLHPPVNLEHPTGNFAYTVGLARTNDPNSGTSQFYINTIDNSTVFDAAVNPPGYATFATVLPFTRSTVDTINQFTYYDAGSGGPFNGALTNLPLDWDVTFPLRPTSYMTVTSASVLGDLTGVETVGWTASVTANPSLVTVSIVDGNLIITPNTQGNRGTATIRIRASSIDGTSFVDDTFTYTVTNYAPVVGGIQGQSGISVGRSMLVSAFGVRDPDSTGGGVSSVEFWYDADNDGQLGNGDTLLGTDATATGGWNARIDTSGMAAGSNRIFARVTDISGAQTTTSRLVTLNAATPIATITPDGVTVNAGEDVQLGFGSLTNAGIRRISLFLDVDGNGSLDPLTDRLIGHATYSSGTSTWSFFVSAADLSTGSNRVFSRVTDSFGNLGAISSSVITVSP